MSETGLAAHSSAPPFALYDLACAGAVCALFLLCVVTAHPFAPSAFNDDWSYAFVAYTLRKTGHLQYSGWGSPMVLFQSFWGAFWTRLFGFSFDVLRLASLPFSCGFVVGVYGLGRKASLKPPWAAFGAAIVCLSPLFLPLAASFMTEPYSCFFTVVCLYAAISSADAKHRTIAVAWLAVLLVAGALGGSSRQTVWTLPMALIPYLAFRRRSDRTFLTLAAFAFAVCVAALLYCSLHFSQPYAPFQVSGPAWFAIARQRFLDTWLNALMLCVTGLLLAWPALLCQVPAWIRLPRMVLVLSAVAAGGLALALLFRLGSSGVIPFVGNVFSPYGVLYLGEDGLGFRPLLLPGLAMLFPSAALFFSATVTFVAIGRSQTSLPPSVRQVFLLSTLAYLPLLLPGTILGFVYDRYTLPILPLVVIWILVHAQAENQPFSAAKPVGWGLAASLLLAFALYGTAVTHDYYATLRARTAAAALAERLGIHQTEISVGFEADGWTELQAAGHVKAVAYHDQLRWNSTSTFWFWKYTPHLHPDYLTITKSGPPVAASKALVQVAFETWMEPRQRYAGVWKASDVPKTQTCKAGSVCTGMDQLMRLNGTRANTPVPPKSLRSRK